MPRAAPASAVGRAPDRTPAPHERARLVIEPGKYLRAVWVTTSTAAGPGKKAPGHIGTWLVTPGVPKEISWDVGGCVAFIALANPAGGSGAGWDGTTTWHGVAVLGAAGGAGGDGKQQRAALALTAPLMADGRRARSMTLAVALAGAELEPRPYRRTDRPQSRVGALLHFGDVTWGEPLPVCCGYKVPDAAGSTQDLVPGRPEAAVRETALRWASYYHTADRLARMSGGRVAKLDPRVQCSVVLGLAGGKYCPESDDKDDRGPSSIKPDDCDGQASDVAVFWRLLADNADAIAGLLAANGEAKALELLRWLLAQYAGVGVLFCTARSPLKAVTSKPFGHAVALLLKRGGPGAGGSRRRPLFAGAQLVEATAPTSPLLNHFPDEYPPGRCAGLIDNAVSNERSHAVHEMLSRWTNRDAGIFQVVAGIRQREAHFYLRAEAIVTADAAYDCLEAPVQDVLDGRVAIERIGCRCDAPHHAEMRLQQALVPRLDRTMEQAIGGSAAASAAVAYAKGPEPAAAASASYCVMVAGGALTPEAVRREGFPWSARCGVDCNLAATLMWVGPTAVDVGAVATLAGDGDDDAAPCPTLDRPPGGKAEPPCRQSPRSKLGSFGDVL